jgi:hypothetical protein
MSLIHKQMHICNKIHVLIITLSSFIAYVHLLVYYRHNLLKDARNGKLQDVQ